LAIWSELGMPSTDCLIGERQRLGRPTDELGFEIRECEGRALIWSFDHVQESHGLGSSINPMKKASFTHQC